MFAINGFEGKRGMQYSKERSTNIGELRQV
jgi:hypothetical protein